jgi:hypothetical protein
MAVRKPLKAFAVSYDADGFATATPSAIRELEATDTIPVANIPTLPQSKITNLVTDLAAKVATTGDETVAGVKTFSSSPIVPTPTTDFQAATKKYVDDNAGAAGYLVYRALLSQTGTDAPVATELENTLGGTVIWTRNNLGRYLGSLSGAFTDAKTFPRVETGMQTKRTFVFRVNDNLVFVQSVDKEDAYIEYDDGGGAPMKIEILIYP